jgi:type I restriction enzyme S subunit
MDDVKYFDPTDYRENTDAFTVEKGDILVAMSGATTGKIGYYAHDFIAYLNQRVGKFLPNVDELNARYLYHFLLSQNQKIYSLAGGGAQPNLSSNALKAKINIPIPYPSDPVRSVAEQERIAIILDKLDTLTTSLSEGLPREIALRQQQYEYYRDLLLSFPKPAEAVEA